MNCCTGYKKSGQVQDATETGGNSMPNEVMTPRALCREIADIREQLATEKDRHSRITCAVEKLAVAIQHLAKPGTGDPK